MHIYMNVLKTEHIILKNYKKIKYTMSIDTVTLYVKSLHVYLDEYKDNFSGMSTTQKMNLAILMYTHAKIIKSGFPAGKKYLWYIL